MSRPLDLSSTVAKMNRANEHFRTLRQEIRDFAQPDLYEVRTQTYRHRREWRKYPRSLVEELGLDQRFRFRQVDNDTLETSTRVIYRSVTARLRKPIPVVRWGVLIGDVINNLRGALDNLVFALTDANFGPPPNPVPHNDQWRDLKFPIAKTGAFWKKTAIPKNLWGLRPRQQARLKKLQPFYRRDEANVPRHWLVVLDELWNADKHRTVNIVREHHGWESLEFHPPGIEKWVDVHVFRARDFGPFIDDTEEIARFRIAARSDRMFNRAFAKSLNMQVYPNLVFEVAFDEGPPAFGANVIQRLMGFQNRVAAVILQFQPDFSEPLPLGIARPPTRHGSPSPEWPDVAAVLRAEATDDIPPSKGKLPM